MNTSDPTRSDFAGPCPRCGGGVPNDYAPGRYPGSLSRHDDATYVCSQCGQEEALWQFLHRDQPLPPLGRRALPEGKEVEA